MFVNKLSDSDGEAAETQVWLDFAHDCGYLAMPTYESLIARYEDVGRMLGRMMLAPEKFIPKAK